jgi:hypothetical protein
MADTYTRAEIAAMLAEVRPDRYPAGDTSWASTVAEKIADGIPPAVARQQCADQVIASIEKGATRRANTLMRHVLADGALPLDWMDAADWPLSVGDQRVCLRALTADDLHVFADDEERAATADHAARLDCVHGARKLAGLLAEHRCHNVAALGRLQEHG